MMFPGCHSGTKPRPATETLVLVREGRVWVKRCIEYVEALRDIPHLLLFKVAVSQDGHDIAGPAYHDQKIHRTGQTWLVSI